MAANARVAEVTAVGRILAEYNNLEIALLHCVQMGIGNFDHTFKTMFRMRGETKRINAARDLAMTTYQALGLGFDFDVAIYALRHALQIRNQYAHWTWWDDNSGQLAIANLEDLAKDPSVVSDFDRLPIYHVDMPLLEAQQKFFVYVDRCLLWVNSEGRFVTRKITRRFAQKPDPIAPPKLYHV
jgi:hypothetical protein